MTDVSTAGSELGGNLLCEALQEPTQPVSLSFQILMGLANAGVTLSLLPVLTILIPAQVSQIDPIHTAASLAWVLMIGATGALVGNPLAGALSDRTTSRMGRRRPWLVAGMALTAAGLVLLANSHSIAALAAGWGMVQFFGNVLFSCFWAILPDRVPVDQRGRTQAIIGLTSPFASIFGALLFGRLNDFRIGYYPVIVILISLVGLFVIIYREPQLPKGVLPAFRIKPFLTSFWVDPRKYPNFGLAWLAWLLVWTGSTLGTGGFYFLYLQNVIHFGALFPGHAVKEGIGNLQIVQIVFGVPLMMLFGAFSDRLKKRKVFVASGAGLITIGLAGLVLFQNWGAAASAYVLIGVGFWTYYSLGLAMVSQVLPSASDRGKDLGVLNIAATLPQMIMPLVGGLMLGIFGSSSGIGYAALFSIGGIAALSGAILMRHIKGVE